MIEDGYTPPKGVVKKWLQNLVMNGMRKISIW